MNAQKVNLASKLEQFSDVMVVKVQGEFVWHSHVDTDDFFLVIEGRLEVRLRAGTVTLGPGRLLGHRPRGGGGH